MTYFLGGKGIGEMVAGPEWLVESQNYPQGRRNGVPMSVGGKPVCGQNWAHCEKRGGNSKNKIKIKLKLERRG